MSKKDLDNYYKTITDQYNEMLENIHEIENSAENNMVSSDMLDNMKTMILPLKTNYERLSYVMFLLNQPARRHKVKKYKDQNKKALEKLDNNNSLEAVVEENKKVIDDLKKENSDLQ